MTRQSDITLGGGTNTAGEDPAPEETSSELLDSLEEFGKITKQLTGAIQAGDYKGAEQLLSDREFVTTRLRRASGIRGLVGSLKLQEAERFDTLVKNLKTSSDQFQSAVREKQSLLAERLVHLQKLRSLKAYNR